MILSPAADKKIAIYAASSANKGGTGVYTERLIAGFADSGIGGVVPIAGVGSGFLCKLFSEHIAIPHRVKKERFDLIHLPAFGGRMVRGLPTVVTIHDMAFMANPAWFSPIRSVYYRYYFPYIAKRASAVVADSDFTVSEIEKYMGLHAQRVYLSAPPNTGSGAFFRKSFHIAGRYILSVGTIEPRKNTKALLQAWPEIRQERPDLTLVIAGRWGWGRKSIRKALTTTSGVMWLQSLSHELLMSAFSGAELLVYPSVYEGFGLPPLEAAASGTPFVIGPAESLSEVYGSVAIGVCGTTARSIAVTVLDSLEKAVSTEALRKFSAGFSNAQMAENTYRVYGRVLL